MTTAPILTAPSRLATLQLSDPRTGKRVLSVEYPPDRESLVRSILSDRYEHACRGVEARRVLDLGAGEGAFACWSYLRWPGAWVDCVELDDELATVCARNLPPGARMVSLDVARDVLHAEDATTYDVVRVGADILGVPFPPPPDVLHLFDFAVREIA